MTTTPKTPDQAAEVPPESDISDAERDALLQETLKSLQEAFSAPDDQDDAGTVTQLNQNPPQKPLDNPELPL